MRKFNKVSFYNYLRSQITDDIIITGSSALQIYGLVKKSSKFDLDLILIQPSEETRKIITNLVNLFTDENSKTEKPYLRDKLGELVTINVPTHLPSKDLSIHIFYKKTNNRPVSKVKILYPGSRTIFMYLILQNPMSIIEAKKEMSRKKDFAQLGEMASLILS